MVRFGIMAVGPAIFLLSGTIPARALLINNLHGNAQISGLHLNSSDGRTKSLGQDYTANWSKSLISYLSARASLHYYNIGVDEIQGAYSWRREFQPQGDLFWNHPAFTIIGNLIHNKATSNDAATNLIRNNSSIAFATRALEYPILKFRYEWDHSFSEVNRVIEDTTSETLTGDNARNTRRRLWQATLSYSGKNQDFYYNMGRNNNYDLITGLRIIDWQHQFRWNQTNIAIGEHLKLNSSYNFIYRSQETSRPAAAPVLRPIPFVAALYAYDPTPDLGQLDTLPMLADGNTGAAVTPPIDIGKALLDRNIGVDFGFPRAVSALYVYTDRPSGTGLGWKVYTSGDNLTWNLIEANVSTIFNTSFSRYEIDFAEQKARYIKAVNFGANDVASALVTEIEVWDLFTASSQEKVYQTSHNINLGSAYVISKVLTSTADFSYLLEPKGEFSDSRNQFFYNLALRHNPKTNLTQDIRFQGGTETFKATNTRNASANLSYNLKASPIKTVEFSFVALTRSNYINRVKTQETNSLFFLTKANLLNALTVSHDIGFSRNNLFDSRSRFDTWTYHFSAGGAVLPSLDANLAFIYQSTLMHQINELRIRRQYRLGINYRITTNIHFSGALAANYETRNIFYSQDYNLGWTMSEKITVGGGFAVNDSRNGVRYERSNAQINFLFSPRTTVFANYSQSNTSLGNGGRISFVQAGLNTGF
jgi:hypothetical protein